MLKANTQVKVQLLLSSVCIEFLEEELKQGIIVSISKRSNLTVCENREENTIQLMLLKLIPCIIAKSLVVILELERYALASGLRKTIIYHINWFNNNRQCYGGLLLYIAQTRSVTCKRFYKTIRKTLNITRIIHCLPIFVEKSCILSFL